MNIESQADVIAALDAIDGENPSQAHSKADGILLQWVEFTHPEVAEAYERVVSRARDWWFA